ncbi:hypothetical protein MA16_Dca022529 [Dendrobium catenatum]|uniref:Uncharacterized protein n=1 Tax=Dendrobium catenatum TaxID=906689 RepID=A0A2I0VJT3_9ASPA|nr:hypothetical protein MA16_Dca022529 [Dendrobium catenatum]
MPHQQRNPRLLLVKQSNQEVFFYVYPIESTTQIPPVARTPARQGQSPSNLFSTQSNASQAKISEDGLSVDSQQAQKIKDLPNPLVGLRSPVRLYKDHRFQLAEIERLRRTANRVKWEIVWVPCAHSSSCYPASGTLVVAFVSCLVKFYSGCALVLDSLYSLMVIRLCTVLMMDCSLLACSLVACCGRQQCSLLLAYLSASLQAYSSAACKKTISGCSVPLLLTWSYLLKFC